MNVCSLLNSIFGRVQRIVMEFMKDVEYSLGDYIDCKLF